MADKNTLSNVRADRFEVFIGTDSAPFEARVQIAVRYTEAPIQPARSGRDMLGSIIIGREVTGRLEFLQCTEDELKDALGIAGAGEQQMDAVGQLNTGSPVRLHDPSDGAGTDGDIIIWNCRFEGIDVDTDGDGLKILVVPFRGFVDATTGDILSIGGVVS